ncbi:hypothetical protein JTB14_004103 [Gonioctena quinquepunctata]|nr:hypothetical protein JTB14_004103 [Gonioctena quinquepunctata]
MGTYVSDLDCGITAIPCLAIRFKLEKYAKFGVFITVLSFVGFFQGVLVNYFRGTSHLWSVHYNLSEYMLGWIIYSNEIFAGIFALCVAYWGNRIHRATWMGALTIFLSVSCITLAIPEIYNPFTGVEINTAITGPRLCNGSLTQDSVVDDIKRDLDEVTVFIFLLFQLMLALANISYLTHGISYIDDHNSSKNSPAFMGLALAANEIGKQIGIYCSWTPYAFGVNGVFVSSVWMIVMFTTFIFGCLMAMFPRTLPNIMMLKSVHSLVSLASGIQPIEEDKVVDGFLTSLWRLLKNKVLLLNIFSFVLMESALINFRLLKQYFNQSKYHVSIEKDSSGYNDPEVVQFTTNLLAQPIFAISLMTAALVISKFKPKAKYLIAWNIFAFLMAAAIFASTAFWNCTKGIENQYEHVVTIPYCSGACGCPLGGAFQPVCVDEKTYFSPCLAGCSIFDQITNLYHNCTCGTTVTEGSCDEGNCRVPLALWQVNNILSNGLLATTLMSYIIINMRSVPEEDKALALGFGLTIMQLVPYGPIRIIYLSIVDKFCAIRGDSGCQLFSEIFPIFLSMTTILLMVLAAGTAMMLLYSLNDLQLYAAKQCDSGSDLEMHDIRPSGSNVPHGNDDTNITTNTRRNISTGNEEELMKKLEKLRNERENIEALNDEKEMVPPVSPGSRTSSKQQSVPKPSSLSESLEAMVNNLVDSESDSDSTSSMMFDLNFIRTNQERFNKRSFPLEIPEQMTYERVDVKNYRPQDTISSPVQDEKIAKSPLICHSETSFHTPPDIKTTPTISIETNV